MIEFNKNQSLTMYLKKILEDISEDKWGTEFNDRLPIELQEFFEQADIKESVLLGTMFYEEIIHFFTIKFMDDKIIFCLVFNSDKNTLQIRLVGKNEKSWDLLIADFYRKALLHRSQELML